MCTTSARTPTRRSARSTTATPWSRRWTTSWESTATRHPNRTRWSTVIYVHDIGKNPDKKVGALNYGYSLVETMDYVLGVDGDTTPEPDAMEHPDLCARHRQEPRQEGRRAQLRLLPGRDDGLRPGSRRRHDTRTGRDGAP